MTALNLAPTPQIAEVLTVAARLTLTERLLVARFLLDSVLAKESDEEADWQQLSLNAFEREWDNEADAIYDNWRELYGVPTR
ncbi:MAG: hypothetical protein KGS73_07440 [Chloroflexi bacterium]|nr:hypothetical protein [Chloroflexota bacterium]